MSDKLQVVVGADRHADTAEAAVRQYYRLVDRQDVAGLVALFSPDAVYRRPGYHDLVGHQDLEHFYQEERVIVDGRHEIDQLIAQPQLVAVHGQFSGRVKSGVTVEVRFADFFQLNTDLLFTSRDTFFFTPLV